MPDSLAIDIGSYTIKAIQGKPGKAVKISRTVEVFNSVGTAVPADDSTTEKLAALLGDTFRDHNLVRTDVRLSFPESLVSTKVIAIPPLSDAELASAIQWQAEQNIPIPYEELSLEYQVLTRPSREEKGQPMLVLLVGVRKSVVEKYLNVFLQLDIEPTILETQTISLMRAMQFTPEDPVTLMVHMGATTTDMAIVADGQLRFVVTNNNGGQLLTRTIERVLQLDTRQAEQYKRTYGIDETQLQGKLREVLLPVLKLSIVEMQKAMQFFVSQNPTQRVARVVLSGAPAQLPGFVQLLTEQLAAEVLTAAPFAGATGEIPEANQPAFPICMGLMMREKN